MTSTEYFKITEEAGIYYRSGDYEKSQKCCLELLNNIESLKKQLPNFKDLNKDFILYSVMLLFEMGINNNNETIFNKILSSNIISKTRFREDIDHCFEFEGWKDIEKTKIISNFFLKLGIYSDKEITKIIKNVEEEAFARAEYEKTKEKITSFIINTINDKKNIMQKELYKMLPEFDGRTILPFIKELEREKRIIRKKEKNDYILLKEL